MAEPPAPQSVTSEQALLGCLLLDNSVLPQAQLEAAEFALPSHRILFLRIKELIADGQPADLVTLAQRLIDNNEAEQVGGLAYVSALTDGQPKLANVAHYVDIIREKARQRRLIAAGQQLAHSAQSGESTEEAERAAIQALSNVKKPGVNGTHKKAAEEAPLIIPDGAWCELGRTYLEAVERTTSASRNYHFAVFLTIAGVVLGRAVNYRNELFPNFFTGLVGESSYAKKGTAMSYGKRLLNDVGSSALWLMSVDSAAGFTKALCDYQTEKKSKEVLCVLHFPELRSLIDKANREGSRDIIPKMAEAYDCENLQRVVVNAAGTATNTFTASLGGAAPQWLSDLSESDLTGGIGNRYCWIPGEAKEPLHRRPPIDREKWNRVVMALHEVRKYWAGAFEERPSSEMVLSDEADVRMEAYGKSLYHDTHGEPLIRELCGRMENHCTKTAMIYAALDGRTVISVQDLDRSILFCDFLLKGLYSIFSEFGISEVVRQERRIIELVTRAGGVMSQRSLQRQLPRMDAETFHRRMRWLASGKDGPLMVSTQGRTTTIYLNQ